MSGISGFGVALLRRAMDFANNAYTGKSAFSKYDLIKYSTSNPKYHPMYYVFEDDNDLWIVIRGTGSDNDWETDFDYAEKSVKFGTQTVKVHGGFYKSATNILNEIKPKIIGYSGRVYVTGHSLGGSITTVLSLLIMSDPDTKSLQTYGLAFAPAPSVSYIPTAYNKKIASIVYSNDIVPTLSIPCTHNLINPLIPKSGVPKVFLKSALKVAIKFLSENNEAFSKSLYKAAIASIDGIVDTLSAYHKNQSVLSVKTLQGLIYKLDESSLKLKQALISPSAINTLSISASSINAHYQKSYIDILNKATD